MKIKIFGSGGGEGIPAVHCGCDNCLKARKAGGKNIKSLSQTVIDGEFLIDLGMDTSWHSSMGLRMSDIGQLLVTHSHGDHFAPDLLFTRGGCFANNMKYETLNIYGNAVVSKRLNTEKESFPEIVASGLKVNSVSPYEKFSAQGYSIYTLRAAHCTDEDALNYIISNGKKAVLYAIDTGLPEDYYYSFIKENGIKLDCVIMDCTMGNMDDSDYEQHMSIKQNGIMKKRLTDSGLVNIDCKFISSHFTHNAFTDHDDMQSRLNEFGIIAAYDGMEIEI